MLGPCFNLHSASLASRSRSAVGRNLPFRRVENVFMKSLHNLISKATGAVIQQDRQIKQVISRIVPANTLTHIDFCRLEAGRLRITVDNATWIAKLRFSERQIVGALREAKLDIVTLSFHVAPAETPVKRTVERVANRGSDEAARAFVQLAASMAVTSEESEQARSGGKGTARPGAHDQAGEAISQSRPPVVRPPDDRLRQELLKLAARLKEEPQDRSD